KWRRGYSEIDGSVRTQTGTPLQGAFVYAAVQNSIQGFGIVDGNGNYQISGLSPNLYTVTVDMPGYAEPNAQPTAVSYLESGTPVYGLANFSVTSQVTAVEQEMDPIPENFSLNQNYPNPFNPSTMIQYALVSPGVVSLKVYNLLGQEVATLASGYQNAGTYKVIFNAKGLAGGVYLYRLQTQGSEIARKMILLQ
ncbi:MAG TPA: T9SS type A sorting domain-containing protein, partial [Bacteroidota bacterium]|nr:T9SS type A sorting domain-containing protein [Bacteroidota bacterium]